MSDETIHEQVERAVEDLLAVAGLLMEDRDEPLLGSWFRRIRAGAEGVMHSPAGREAAMIAAHAVDTRLVLAQDAAVTATLLQNVGPVIASLQPTKDAVIRAQALLIVKVDWVVGVIQLTDALDLAGLGPAIDRKVKGYRMCASASPFTAVVKAHVGRAAKARAVF